jgi:hypothetical protein
MSDSLPPEILFQVLLNLPRDEIIPLCSQSSHFYNLCSDWTFWAEKASRDFQYPREDFLAASRDQSPWHRYSDISFLYHHPTHGLIEAAKRGQIYDVRYLIPKIQHLGDTSPVLNRALVEAASRGYFEIVKSLRDHGAKAILTALNLASQEGQLDIVLYLLDQLPPERQAKARSSVITYAIIRGHPNLAEAVATTLPLRDHALRVAAMDRSMDLIRHLVSTGVSEEGLNRALIEAAEANSFVETQYLLDHGATAIPDALNHLDQLMNQVDTPDYSKMIQFLQQRLHHE